MKNKRTRKNAKFQMAKCKACSFYFRKKASNQLYCSIRCRNNATDIKIASIIALEKKTKTTKDNFYKSREWLELRYRVLRKSSAKCMLCGASSRERILHVDHIKPISKFPELILDENNLQVLCDQCNLGKSNKFYDDWRNR